MAPRRLYPRGWKKAIGNRKGWRWWLIRHTPDILIDYLFEILLAFIAALTSVGYLSGFSSSRAVVRLLPPYVAIIYAVVLLIGALTVGLGLGLKRYGTVAASGLKLLSVACLVYTISVVWYLSLEGSLSIVLMSMAFCLLAAWRSFLLHSTYLLVTSAVARGSHEDIRGP